MYQAENSRLLGLAIQRNGTILRPGNTSGVGSLLLLGCQLVFLLALMMCHKTQNFSYMKGVLFVQCFLLNNSEIYQVSLLSRITDVFAPIVASWLPT